MSANVFGNCWIAPAAAGISVMPLAQLQGFTYAIGKLTERMDTENESELVLPLIHLNGSGKDMLLREYEAAAESLRDFMDVFLRTTLHPRDYYPLGDDAWEKALASRMEINAKLMEVENYLRRHIQSLYES